MRHHPVGVVLGSILALFLAAEQVRGDGKLFRPRGYNGSLEERSQEAIILFRTSEQEGGSFEDLILKIGIKGKNDQFAWVIPFPREPKVEKEDARLFQELHQYVQDRLAQSRGRRTETKAETKSDVKAVGQEPVEVLSKRVVGSYSVAIVRERQAGALNQWLEKEGYQSLPDDAEDVIGFYREKGYVFACIKVKDASTGNAGVAELHPLRFSFRTGGSDGIYFPMKMSGLQSDPFSVNLYVFFGAWINDRLSQFGYVHRGFALNYRDWDSPRCEPNAGKSYSAPQDDPFLRGSAPWLPTVTRLFQKLHPGERFYLTNIQAYDLKPEDVRQWSDDLWLFPYNTRPGWVPHDVRPGGVASAAWPDARYVEEEAADENPRRFPWLPVGGTALLGALGVGAWLWHRRATARPLGAKPSNQLTASSATSSHATPQEGDAG